MIAWAAACFDLALYHGADGGAFLVAGMAWARGPGQLCIVTSWFHPGKVSLPGHRAAWSIIYRGRFGSFLLKSACRGGAQRKGHKHLI